MEFTDPRVTGLEPDPVTAASDDLEAATDRFRDVVADAELAALDADTQDGRSDLDDLEAELTAAVTPSTVIPVLGRPAFAVRFRTDFTGKELDALRKAAADKRFADGIDGVKFAALLLAKTCLGILRHDSEDAMREALGVTAPVTFVTRELQGKYATTGSADATVRKFYGLEGHVDATARRLMAEAGWGDDVYATDPTQ